MPRVSIPINVLTRNTALQALTWVDADLVNNHEWTPANGRDILIMQRGGPIAQSNFEILSTDNKNGRPASSSQGLLQVAGSGTVSISQSLMGPFPTKGWVQSDGKIYVNNTVDGGSSIRMAVLRMPFLPTPRLYKGTEAVPAGTRTQLTPRNLIRPEDENSNVSCDVVSNFMCENDGSTIFIYNSGNADPITVYSPPDKDGRAENITFTSPGLEDTIFSGVSIIGPLDPELFNYVDGQIHVSTTSSNRRGKAWKINMPSNL